MQVIYKYARFYIKASRLCAPTKQSVVSPIYSNQPLPHHNLKPLQYSASSMGVEETEHKGHIIVLYCRVQVELEITKHGTLQVHNRDTKTRNPKAWASVQHQPQLRPTQRIGCVLCLSEAGQTLIARPSSQSCCRRFGWARRVKTEKGLQWRYLREQS